MAMDLILELFQNEVQMIDQKGDHDIEIIKNNDFIQAYSQISPFYIITYWDRKFHKNFEFEGSLEVKSGKKRIKKKMFYWFIVYLLPVEARKSRKTKTVRG